MLTGGTDVHLVLVDLTATGLDGKTAESRLEEVGITVNRNAIPFDERPPMNPSGLRIGTPALTTRGLVEDDMREIAEVIATALSDRFEAERDGLAKRTQAPDGPLPALPPARGRRRLAQAAPPERSRGRVLFVYSRRNITRIDLEALRGASRSRNTWRARPRRRGMTAKLRAATSSSAGSPPGTPSVLPLGGGWAALGARDRRLRHRQRSRDRLRSMHDPSARWRTP